MIIEDLVREWQIATRNSLMKTVGDLMSESEQSAETELLAKLSEAEHAYEAAWNVLVAAKQKLVAGLSPSARAAIELTGSKADLEVKRRGVEKFELQKALAAERAKTARRAISKNLGEQVATLRKFREYARAVVDGKVQLDEKHRRRLGVAIAILELEVREAIR